MTVWNILGEFYSPESQHTDWTVSESEDTTQYNTIVREVTFPSTEYYVSTGLSWESKYPSGRNPFFKVDFVEKPKLRRERLWSKKLHKDMHSTCRHGLFSTPHDSLMVDELWDGDNNWIATACIRKDLTVETIHRSNGKTYEQSMQRVQEIKEEMMRVADEKGSSS